jgi:site-specific recombinase XerD
LTFVGAKPLAAVTRLDVQNYWDALKAVVIPATARRAEHSLASSSQIRMLASLKGLLTHANGIGYTPFNPGKGVALPTLPELKRDKALSQSQSMKMLVTAQNRGEATETQKRAKTRWRDYLLNEVCYFTGGRISEELARHLRDRQGRRDEDRSRQGAQGARHQLAGGTLRSPEGDARRSPRR